MHQCKRLLVGVSFANQDGTSIRYAAMISKIAQSEKVFFLHVASKENIPDDLLKEYPDLFRSVDQYAQKEMEELVHQHFDGYPDTEVSCEVVEGSQLIEFLRKVKEDDIDLIVMTKRREHVAKGTLNGKLARKSPCSVLFVPEGSDARIPSMLVPVDFSDNSLEAMKTAMELAAAASNVPEIYCLHVYSVPTGYYKTGKSYEQFAEIMKGHAEKHYREFIEKVDLKGCKVVPIFTLDDKEYRGIGDVIKKYGISLVVIGSRGRKAGAGVLLGSVTEHLIEETTTPLMAVKKKGATGMSFLDAILEL